MYAPPGEGKDPILMISALTRDTQSIVAQVIQAWKESTSFELAWLNSRLYQKYDQVDIDKAWLLSLMLYLSDLSAEWSLGLGKASESLFSRCSLNNFRAISWQLYPEQGVWLESPVHPAIIYRQPL